MLLKIKWKKYLNQVQLKCIEELEKPLLVLAGAGTGKTRVITYKVAYLISEKNILPYNILCVTFTNKAAEEMKQRITELLSLNPRYLWINTFHSAALKILKLNDYYKMLGYRDNFTIVDTVDQQNIIKKILKEYNVDKKKVTPQYILFLINSIKQVPHLPDEEVILLQKFIKEEKKELYVDLIKKYYIYLRENNLMDFGDLLLKLYQLIKSNEDVKKYLKNKFDYILIDEFQDTNSLQYELIKELAGKDNITIVGDDDQSIYSWRGAMVENFKKFQRDFPDYKIIKLEKNYRSSRQILNLANKVVEKIKDRIGKNLYTDKNGNKPIFIYVYDDRDEASFIISEIKRLHSLGIPYSEIAIFYRTNWQSRIFEEYLNKEKIPYQLIGAFRFFERKEIKILINYLKFFNAPDNLHYLEHIISVPRRGIGQSSLKKLRLLIENENIKEISDYLKIIKNSHLSNFIKDKFLKFFNQLFFINSKIEKDGLLEGIKLLIDTINYENYVKEELSANFLEYEKRWDNVKELVNFIARNMENNPDYNLSEFIDEISLLTSSDEIENEDRVLLLTFHCAKGLEFEVVFITALEEGLLPHYKALDFPDQYEEERRLFYVGITRAKEYLYLTSARQRWIYGKIQKMYPSSFIDEDFLDNVKMYNGLLDYNLSLCDEHNSFSEKKKEYKLNGKILHPIFGLGYIVKIEDDNIHIKFLNGKIIVFEKNEL